MHLPTSSWVLYGLAAIGVAAQLFELYGLWLARHLKRPAPERFPGFSVLVPLAGADDELLQNLESHLAVDYPGDWELLLGVRDRTDAAYPVARALAARRSDRVRLFVQEGEPGFNPKVNQLITLTRHARYEVVAVADSNVRVTPSHLSEHAATLAQANIGLSYHGFCGVGERRLGAVLDNLTLASFAAPNLSTGMTVLHLDQVVGKSVAVSRAVLTEIGGWWQLKDVLAEDQRLGAALHKLGLHSAMCPSLVFNVQRDQGLRHFWDRNSRWAMIRFRVLMPGVLLEPLLNTTVLTLAAAAVAGTSAYAWAVAGLGALFSIAYAQSAAHLARGYGFRLQHLLWVPLRDVLFFAAWVRGATMREVTWRGNRLEVQAKTRLAPAHPRTRPVW